MTGPPAGQQRRSPETPKPRRHPRSSLHHQRNSERQQLRGRHIGETAAAKATGAAMATAVQGRARADVSAKYGYQWALLLADRHAPDFLARVASLQAEEAAALSARVAELMPTVNAQRAASQRMLADRHRRERAGLRHKWQALGRQHAMSFGQDAFEVDIKRQWQRVLFVSAGRRLTRRQGLRLVFRRQPVPNPTLRH